MAILVAVSSSKGGTGKSTLSKELAMAFSLEKVDGKPLKVCVVDCDFAFGDITTLFKLNPYPTVTHWTADVSQRLAHEDKSEIKYTQPQIESRYLIKHESGIKVLSAPASHAEELDITGKEFSVVLDNLMNCDYDIIILDTGNNTRDYTIAALEKSDVVLMVTTLDLTTISDNHALLFALKILSFPTEKIKLVLNRVWEAESDIDTSEISQSLGYPISVVVPEYPEIRVFNNRGQFAMLSKPNIYNGAIKKIVDLITPLLKKINTQNL